MISGKEAQNSQNYWGQGGAIIRQTVEGGGTNCEKEVKLIGIGMHKWLSLDIGEHKRLSPCQTLAVLSRFIICHTRHVTHVTLCDLCDNILSHI